MEIISETILENYFKNEDIRLKHKGNEDFFKLAIKNVNLSERLGLKKGLVYDCKDDTYFNIRLPSGKKVFQGSHKYRFPEIITVVTSHYVFLKNKWIEVPVNVDDIVSEVYIAYPPLTENLKCKYIRDSLTDRIYSLKLFEYNDLGNTIRPRYLPTKIEL